MKPALFLSILFLFVIRTLNAQTEASTYQWPEDSLVKQNLVQWQDMKFGVLISWGLYSQKGILESWGLCPEDEDWIGRNGYANYFSYANDYRNTKSVFNPVQFNPEQWAAACHKGGVKYMIFVTKHHDGFCMFDSKFTDFKVTDKTCPFSPNPRSNIAKEVFTAFRDEGLAVGAYFSKPDWTSPDFWWHYFPPKDRNPNYDITKHPERWNNFVKYTHNQVNELMSGYGKLDILWLDGCWVRPLNTIDEHVEAFCKYPHDMDIRMKSVAANARVKQPGILVVDRWVPGPYEDYLTPEQKTPEKALEVPWESCITMASDWGWTPNARYKSSTELIQLLVNIVAKGGNLLLGIGPNGKGQFDEAVYERLDAMGRWLDVNGEAIYGTRPAEPFREGQVAYTGKGANTLYAIYLPGKDMPAFPAEIDIRTTFKGKIQVRALGKKERIRYERTNDGIRIHIPQSMRIEWAQSAAVTFKITSTDN